eukprot:366363-Chlamydomonas_euryale.AAC.13
MSTPSSVSLPALRRVPLSAVSGLPPSVVFALSAAATSWSPDTSSAAPALVADTSPWEALMRLPALPLGKPMLLSGSAL